MNSITPNLKSSPSSVRVYRKRKWTTIFRYRWFYFMMLPGIIYFVLFQYGPMVGVVMAFKDYNLLKGLWRSDWVGFQNFAYIFSTPDFYNIISNTLIISFYRIVFNMFPDLILALMLNEIRVMWFKRTIQTITYGPHFLSWVVVYGIVYAFLAPDAGLVNQTIRDFGGQTIDFLTNPDFFRTIVISSDIWKNTGFGAIIYLAALATVDPTLYEAARVDGASRWRQLWHITLPGVANVFILLLILRIGHILDAGFEQIFIFHNTRVYAVSDIIDTWVYRRGLEQLDFGVATAVGLFKGVIGLILVVGTNSIAKRMGQSSIW
jgi:putative aldouronate transport system permease protein